MLYKEFGRTGKMVSALGMGVSRFVPSEYAVPGGLERCAQIILKAWENGVNYFDVAPTYCGWKAEEILGLAVREMKGDYFISTKSSSTQDPTADAVRRRLETSLKRLGVEKVAFYNMWGILNYEQYLDVIKPGGPYEGAMRAKEEGLIEHICFSAHCTGEEVEKILEDDRFEGITLGYNAINFKYREKGLLAAAEKGLGVAIMNPLYGGVIPQNPGKFDFIRNEDGQTLAQAALLFVASQEPVSVVLSGMTTEKDIEENTSCFSAAHTFSVGKVEAIKEKIVSDFDSLCTGCNYCAGCPQDIKINQLMLAYNQYVLTDHSVSEFHRYMKEVWRYTEDMLFDCKACGLCEKKCTQHLPVIRRIQEINQFAKEYRKGISSALEKTFSISDAGKLGIYAAGPFAERLVRLYRQEIGDLLPQLYFFDSNSDKWGRKFCGDYTIYDPKDIVPMGITKIVIASEAFYQEIYQSIRYLEKYGIEICRAEVV